MDIFAAAERLMGMSNATWARHANSWSVYTRAIGSVAVFFAFWSLHWIGPFSLAPIAIACLWTWLNPRLFRAPATTSGWAARGVLGERALIHRKAVSIPVEHLRLAWITTAFSAVFLAIGIFGLVTANFWAAFAGWHAAVLSKMWFVDRMAWLWDVMKDKHPVYEAWNRAEWNAELGH